MCIARGGAQMGKGYLSSAHVIDAALLVLVCKQESFHRPTTTRGNYVQNSILQSCWRKHLKTEMGEGHTFSCSCLVENCTARPTREFFAAIFGEDSDEYRKVRMCVRCV